MLTPLLDQRDPDVGDLDYVVGQTGDGEGMMFLSGDIAGSDVRNTSRRPAAPLHC